MNYFKVFFAVTCWASLGSAQRSAKQDFSAAILGTGAEFHNSTEILLYAAASSYANFSVPAIFPSDVKSGDPIYVTVGLEVSNPGEAFDSDAPKKPKTSELCELSIGLGNTILWVGKLLPTYSVLQIGSNYTATYGNETMAAVLTIQQDCPNPPSEFLVYNASLTLDKPISDVQTSSITSLSSTTAQVTALSATSSNVPAASGSSASTLAKFGLYSFVAVSCFVSWL